MVSKKLTRFDLQKMKEAGKTAVWITAYDYWTANFAEQAGMDMILVGDSLGMCVYGYAGTVPVTMDQCIWHSEAVRRGAPNTFIIGDMPFLSYQVSVEEAVRAIATPRASSFIRTIFSGSIRARGICSTGSASATKSCSTNTRRSACRWSTPTPSSCRQPASATRLKLPAMSASGAARRWWSATM